MKTKSLRVGILYLIAIALSACGGGGNSNSTPSDTTPPNNPAVTAVIQNLMSSVPDTNIVVAGELNTETNEYILRLEDGTEISIDNALLSSVVDQTSAWRIQLTFTDNQSVSLARLGDSVTIAEADIALNPNGTTPLAAQLNLALPVANKIGITVLGKEPTGVAISHLFEDFQRNFQLPILGLYEDYANQVLVTLYDEDDNERIAITLGIQTPSLASVSTPVIPMTLEILENNLAPNDSNLYMVSGIKQAFDQYGEVRWIYTGAMSDIYRKLDNGNLIGASNENSLVYHHEAVKIISMLGAELNRIPIDNLMHHDAHLLPNGNLLVAGNTNSIAPNGQLFATDDLPEEDVIFEIDLSDNSTVNTFDYNLILDPSRIRASGRPDDWLHLNSLFFDEDNSAIVISAQAQSAVVSIDYPSGELNWILSAHEGWPEDLQPFLLSPVDQNGNALDISDIDFWTYGQHAALVLPNNNILVYDNGQFRGFYKDNAVNEESYSRAIEYQIDRENREVSIVWQYERDQELFTPITGDIDFEEETGNRLIGYMAGMGNAENDIPRIIEIDQNDNILFDVVVNRGATFYRAEKFNLYEGIE